MSQAKPFDISKQVVMEAYRRVRANQGACGVDEETIQDFEENRKDNLYKIWTGCPQAVTFLRQYAE